MSVRFDVDSAAKSRYNTAQVPELTESSLDGLVP